jgi:hypothetical protein
MSSVIHPEIMAALLRVEAFNEEQRAKTPKNWRQRAGLSEHPKPPLGPDGWERLDMAVNRMLGTERE